MTCAELNEQLTNWRRQSLLESHDDDEDEYDKDNDQWFWQSMLELSYQ